MGSEERVSEAEPSSSLLIPGFSVFPDFVVFPASWSGADASHIPALNTSSTSAFHCFRTFLQSSGSPRKSRFVYSAGLFSPAFYAIISSLIREGFLPTVTHAERLLIFGRSVSGHLPDDGRNPLILFSGKGDIGNGESSLRNVQMKEMFR